jgi:CDP-diglyceride synthetase
MEAQHGETGQAQMLPAHSPWARWSGVAGAVGGVCLTASAVMQAMQPPGCIAEDCAGRAYRSAGPAEGLLFVAGILLVAAATLGFLALSTGVRGRSVVRFGAVTAAAGMFLGLVLMGSALYFAGVALVIIALVAYAVLGVGLAATRALPVWAGVMLAVSALLLFGSNDQNERILFVVPFGLAWVVLGALLWSAAPAGQRRRGGNVQLA